MADSWLNPGSYDPNAKTPSDTGNWSDYPLALGGAIAGLIGDGGAGLRAIGEEADPENKAMKGTAYFGHLVQNVFGQLEEDANGNLSDKAKERISSAVTDGDFWTLPSLAIKGLQTAPAVAAIAIPSALLSGTGLGAAYVAGAGGAMNAATVVDEMYKKTDAMSDQELQDGSPLYKELRTTKGLSEEDARASFNHTLRGLKPVYAAGIGAIANSLGVGGQVARGLEGKAASAIAEEGAGLIKRTATGAGEGALGGAIQGGGNDALVQSSEQEGGLREGYDVGQSLEAAGSGAAIGGVLGAAAGAAFGGHGEGGAEPRPNVRPSIDPALELALDPARTPPAAETVSAQPSSSGQSAVTGVPDATVAGVTAEGNPIGGMADIEARRKATATEAPVAGPNAEQTVALVSNNVNEASSEVASSSPAATEAKAPAAPSSPSPAAGADQVRAPEPTVGSQPVPGAAEVRGPAVPPSTGPRILEDVSPVGRVKSQELGQQAKEEAALRMKDLQTQEDARQRAETGVTTNKRGADELAARQAIRDKAAEIAKKYAPTKGEDLIHSKNVKDRNDARNLILARAKAMVDDWKASKLALPKKFKDSSDPFNPETQLLMEAHALVNTDATSKKGLQLQQIKDFTKREEAIRSGAADEAVRARREAGDLAKRGDQTGAASSEEGGVKAGEMDNLNKAALDRVQQSVEFGNPEDILAAKQEGTYEGAGQTGPIDAKIPARVQAAVDAAIASVGKKSNAAVTSKGNELKAMRPEGKVKLGPKLAAVKEKVEAANGNKPEIPALKKVQDSVAKAKEANEVVKKQIEEAKAKLEAKKASPPEPPVDTKALKEAAGKAMEKKLADAKAEKDARERGYKSAEAARVADEANDARLKAEREAPRAKLEYPREYDPKTDHIHLKEMNDVIDWANNLPDNEYAVLQKEYGGNAGIRREIGNRNQMENLQKEFQSRIDQSKPAKETRAEKAARKEREMNERLDKESADLREAMGRAREKTNVNPTEAQKAEGNYAKGTVSIHGNEIAIETPKGENRTGKDESGRDWSVKMPVDYGYLKGTKGADGDPIDVFVGPDHDASYVYIVDQLNADTGAFDEHKVMMGFKSDSAAEKAYERSFSDERGDERYDGMTKMSMEEFKRWKKEQQDTPAADVPASDKFEARNMLTDADLNGPPKEGYVRDSYTGEDVKPVYSAKASDVMNSLKLDHLQGAMRAIAGTARNVLNDLVGHVDVHFLKPEDMQRIAEEDHAPLGVHTYSDGKDQIFIREDVRNDPQKLLHTILHESTHAATIRKVVNDAKTRSTIEALMTHVQHALENSDSIPEDLKAIRYGMSKPEEFVAEALSNPRFQEVLSRMEAPPEVSRYFGLDNPIKNMWDALVTSVRKALGLPKGAHTLLEAALKVTERSMISRGTVEGRGERSLLRGDVVGAVKDAMAEAKRINEHAPTEGRPWMLGTRTMDNIARAADRYFGGNNPIRKIANAIEGQRVRAQQIVARADPIINKIHQLERRYKGEQWNEFASLVHDETMAGVYADRGLDTQKHISKEGRGDAWARAQHPELARRWARLPGELKALRTEAMQHFTDAQNRLAQKLIRNRIVTMFDTTDPEGLATRIHEGTVTDADKAMMGEAYDAIKAANTLSKIDGPYMPLMRRGNYVVKGNYEVKAPRNATKISDNEFEFTDEAAATKWASEQSLRPTMRTIYKNDAGETGGVVDGKQYQYTAQDIDATPHYRVSVQDRHVEMFDSMKEARSRVAELRAAGMNVDDAVPRAFENYGIQADALSTQMRRLATVMERRADARNYTPEQKADLLRTLNEVSLSMLGSTRIQSRNLPRQYVAGASKDLLRNTVEYTHASANYEAKLDFRPQLDGALSEMHDAIKAEGKDGLSAGRQDIANEIMRRATTTNPAAEGKVFNALSNRLLSLSFMDKLMSPSYSVVNATQPMMTTTPHLAAHYGIAKAYGAMAKAYRDIQAGATLREGMKATWDRAKGNLEGNDPASLIMSRLKDKGEQEMMQVLLDRGIIDQHSGLEVGQLIRDQRKIIGALDSGLGWAEGIGRQMPKAIEAINRSVSALAAYRLEMARSGDQARAIQFAQDTVNQTQFNYSSSNSAPWMKHPLARLAFQFKKYGQGMYQMLGEQAAIAVRNENPGDRARAIKSISYTLGMHAMIAGVMGLPTEPIKMAVMAANGLGLTDWSWGDVEDAQREAMAGMFGKDFGEAISKGLPRLAGIDLSSRMGLDTLMGPFGEPRTNDAQGWKAFAWDSMSGAPAGLLADWAGGIGSLASGDFTKAAEKMIPIKAVSDNIKAYRILSEGNVTSRGKQSMTPFSPVEAAAQAFGFGSSRVAETQALTGQFFRQKQEVEGARREFQRQWAEGTGAARGRLWTEVQKWNKSVDPDARLSLSDLRGYQRRMVTDMKNTKHGIAVKKREMQLMKRSEGLYNTER